MPEAIAAPRRQFSAILFADVHGYSRLMAKNEDRTYERLTQSLRLIRSLMADYGGQFIRTAGDGVLALFETAAQALEFAIAIQREFRNDAVWNADDEPIVFRIGINLGEVLIGEADIQGHSVNVAARIQALARPGGICVTQAVQRALQDTCRLPVRPLGPQHLRNISEPVEVFAIEVNGPPPQDSTLLPPLPSEIVGPPSEASVAVLPLSNMSGDPRDDHLCDGITGDVITNLTRFRDLLVIARHSAYVFRDKGVPLDQIGRQLGVRYLLTGGLQRAGTRLRLRVQLTEADQATVIWADRYDGDLSDVFAFQDDVTSMIAARLAVQISAAERRRVLATHKPEVHSYGLVLRGQALSLQFKKEPNFYARRLFEQACEIDPDYGRSYAGISRTFNREWRYSWVGTPEASLDQAVNLALTAIDRDSFDARGYSSLGFAYLYKKQLEASLAAYRRALELNPNDADIIVEYADALVYDGEPRKSLDLIERAMRLNPYYPDWYLWNLGDAYFHLGDYEQTIASVSKMRNPAESHRLLASSYAHLGIMDKARYHAEQLRIAHPNFSITHWRNVPPSKNPADLERFVEGLRKAGLS